MANRKSRRRDNKKAKKIESVGTFDNDVLGKVYIALIVICILGLFYLLTLYITNKHSTDSVVDDNKTTEETSISYDNIIVGRSLSMSSDNYLVIFYDSSNEEINNTYSSLVSSYRAKGDNLPLYFVDMSSSFNKSYINDNSNKNPSSVEDIKISGPTLMRVENNKVAEYIEGQDSITDYLN